MCCFYTTGTVCQTWAISGLKIENHEMSSMGGMPIREFIRFSTSTCNTGNSVQQVMTQVCALLISEEHSLWYKCGESMDNKSDNVRLFCTRHMIPNYHINQIPSLTHIQIRVTNFLVHSHKMLCIDATPGGFSIARIHPVVSVLCVTSIPQNPKTIMENS